jgi:hypothetical protein
MNSLLPLATIAPFARGIQKKQPSGAKARAKRLDLSSFGIKKTKI